MDNTSSIWVLKRKWKHTWTFVAFSVNPAHIRPGIMWSRRGLWALPHPTTRRWSQSFFLTAQSFNVFHFYMWWTIYTETSAWQVLKNSCITVWLSVFYDQLHRSVNILLGHKKAVHHQLHSSSALASRRFVSVSSLHSESRINRSVYSL